MWFACEVKIDFCASERPTVGVEWEFALVDKTSRDLVNSAEQLFELAQPRLQEGGRLHHELLKNTVELVTGICETVPEAMADLQAMLDVIVPAADEVGVDLFGAGTHPFASWSRQQLTPGPRYEELINRTQWWGRQMLIWGVTSTSGCPSATG